MIYVQAVCPTCRQMRTIVAWNVDQARERSVRQCKPCWTVSARKLPPQKGVGEMDWAAVERLIAGVPVRSSPADRRAAVESLYFRGLTTRQIADRMRVSQRTVFRWLRSIKELSA